VHPMLQPKSAFSCFPLVHSVDLKGRNGSTAIEPSANSDRLKSTYRTQGRLEKDRRLLRTWHSIQTAEAASDGGLPFHLVMSRDPDALHSFDQFTVTTPIKLSFGTFGYNEKAATQSWSELEAFLKR
jgi:hypothetical protein